MIDRLVGAGGTELHLLDLAKGLSSRNIQITVVSFNDGDFAQGFIDDPNIKYHSLNAPCIYNFRGWKALLWIHKYTKKEKVDIIQSFHTASDLAAPILGLFSFGKIVVISSRRDLGYTKKKVHKLLHRVLNRFVKFVLANSQQVKQAIIASEHISPQKVRVIYNGIKVDKVSTVSDYYRGQYRLKYGMPSDCLLIGALGNSRPVKGFVDLVQAAKLLITSYPEVCFVLAGESDDLTTIIEASGLKEKFFLLGPVYDIGNYLHALDVYVQPSHSEGFSNSVLEAMLAKLPVIVSDVGGNIEIVSHAHDGLVFQAKCVDDLVSKIELVINDLSSFERIATNAQEKVISNFLIDRMLDEYCDFYGEVCG